MDIKSIISKYYKIDNNKYIPMEIGRQEYRIVGNKIGNRIEMRIEEVLFTLEKYSKISNLNEYSISNEYIHYNTYRSLRLLGYILIRVDSYKYIYRVYRPDKNYNRNKIYKYMYMIIVLPEESINREIYGILGVEEVILCISDNNTYILVKSSIYNSVNSLLEEYNTNSK
ncbi:hypothetical protein NEOKW01_2054 [Nematocida sp. AWRm80]|nr:hypothetical protein NEOKW01_2054 [Nematocida sp. AWRm80]